MYREKKFKVEGLKNKPAPVEASSAFMKWMLLLIGIRGKGYSLKSFPPSWPKVNKKFPICPPLETIDRSDPMLEKIDIKYVGFIKIDKNLTGLIIAYELRKINAG